MSLLSLDYQSAIRSLNWDSKNNNNPSKFITEWMYFKESGNPPVEFDRKNKIGIYVAPRKKNHRFIRGLIEMVLLKLDYIN